MHSEHKFLVGYMHPGRKCDISLTTLNSSLFSSSTSQLCLSLTPLTSLSLFPAQAPTDISHSITLPWGLDASSWQPLPEAPQLSADGHVLTQSSCSSLRLHTNLNIAPRPTCKCELRRDPSWGVEVSSVWGCGRVLSSSPKQDNNVEDQWQYQ